MKQYRREFLAGQDVAAAIAARRLTLPAKGSRNYDEALCALQRTESALGYLEAQIVESNYGYSVRYASGLQNWGIIYSSRSKQVDGTLEDAIAKAREWQAVDPRRRYVTRMVEG